MKEDNVTDIKEFTYEKNKKHGDDFVDKVFKQIDDSIVIFENTRGFVLTEHERDIFGAGFRIGMAKMVYLSLEDDE